MHTTSYCLQGFQEKMLEQCLIAFQIENYYDEVIYDVIHECLWEGGSRGNNRTALGKGDGFSISREGSLIDI